MKKLLMVILAGVMSFMFLGCRDTQLRDLTNNPIATYGDKQLSIVEIEKAIIRGGANAGWVMQKTQDGVIRGTYQVNASTAIVNVIYNLNEYNIVYIDSINLRYNSEEKLIHKYYLSWIQSLNKAIQVQITTL